MLYFLKEIAHNLFHQLNNKGNKMKSGYWIFDEYEDEWVYVPSADELAW